MKQNKDELRQKYTDQEFLNNFKNLFSLRILFYNSIIKEGYIVPTSIGAEIQLSEYGEKLLKKLKEGEHKNEEEHLLKFALLMEFYHEELIIDVFKTNIVAVEELLHKQVIDNSLIHPWVYGRLLYDKYFEEFEDQEEILKHNEVIQLLDKTPKGVFQVGNYIIGSLGLLKSNVSRFIPPKRTIKLWHCSDPSCSAFHEVHLASGESKIPKLIQAIDGLLRLEPSSDWGRFYFDLIENEDFYYDSNRLIESPYLLINALGNSEIKSLLKEIIDTDKNLREKFPNDKRLKGSSDTIVNAVEKDVCFQILLLESDEQNIKSLEKLIDDQTIFIPPTEIRRPITKVARGFYRVHHEFNKLGIRSTSSQSNLGLRQMNNLLKKIYSEPALKQQLEWKLRNIEKETLNEKLETYTLQEEPRKIIREIVFAGPSQLSETFKYLYGNFKMPTNMQEEEILIDKILWKLGFDINIYPTSLPKFWEMLQNFKDTVRSCGTNNDGDKEKIRSAAVNFWISLEEILEQTLSFMTWTILSDHFLQTQFKYNFEEARNFMCDKLHGYQIGSTDPLIFDKEGKNTLFPLAEGFTALLGISESLLAEGSEKYKRKEEDMPSFWHKTDLISFPFESTIYLFDIKPSNFKLLTNLLAEIPKSFTKNKVLSVRNRTQHKRDDFPSQDEILNACNCVEDIVCKIEVNGIYPNVFLFKNTMIDKFNRTKFEYEDYKGRNITLQPTFEFSGSKLPGRRSPQIIVPILTIGNSQELLRFKFEESSSYLKFWKDFPRKKAKKKKKETVKHETTTSALES
ncbi:hypothetical protein ABTW24_22765 [Sphingobacterium thalpophilum]|uniref:Lantibiotic dehydratase, C terminus n=1 Tax=Sphingobacterium thalpophilum TaxID=259 RepID=A0ABV4HJD8_9SPHI